MKGTKGRSKEEEQRGGRVDGKERREWKEEDCTRGWEV